MKFGLATLFLFLIIPAPAISEACKQWSFADQVVGRPPVDWEARGGPAESTYRVTEESDNRYLKAASQKSGVQLGVSVAAEKGAAYTLSWRWRIHQLPAGADERKISTMDSAAAVYAIFGGRLSPKILKYVWSSTLNAGMSFEHPRSSSMRIIVVGSGQDDLGEWQTVTRNLSDDFRKYFGADVKELSAIGIKTDSDSTSTRAEADYDDVLLCRN